jgi:agmatinase
MVNMVNQNDRFFELPDDLAELETAAAAILPVPYDLTSTWKKGADKAPEAIIEASHHIEWWDPQVGEETCRRGIATLEPILCHAEPERLADLVDKRMTELLQRGVLAVMMGGDHSVSIGAIRAAAREVEDLTVLQIDAHSDLRDEYAGSRFNHGCVMARAAECCPAVHVGIRAFNLEEAEKLDPDRVVYAHQINGPSAEANWIGRAVGQLSDRVYVTIDVDGFDPAYVPATGTPEPGGLDWYQVTSLLERVAQEREVVAFDVVELLPTPGQWASEFLAAKLIYRFLGHILSNRS